MGEEEITLEKHIVWPFIYRNKDCRVQKLNVRSELSLVCVDLI